MMQTTLRKIRGAGPCGMHLENDRRMAYLDKEHALIAAKHIFALKGGEL